MLPATTNRWKSSCAWKTPGQRTGPRQEVENGSEAVKHAPGDNRNHGPVGKTAGDLEVAEESAPSHPQVEPRVQPRRQGFVREADRDAQRGPEPGHAKNASPPVPPEESPGDRGISAGDQHVDSDMVQKLKWLDPLTRQPDAVIKRAARGAEDQAQPVDQETDLLRSVSMASLPQHDDSAEGNHQPQSMAPGVDRFARVEKVHASSQGVSLVGPVRGYIILRLKK